MWRERTSDNILLFSRISMQSIDNEISELKFFFSILLKTHHIQLLSHRSLNRCTWCRGTHIHLRISVLFTHMHGIYPNSLALIVAGNKYNNYRGETRRDVVDRSTSNETRCACQLSSWCLWNIRTAIFHCSLFWERAIPVWLLFALEKRERACRIHLQ